ncbi:MAG TPA: NADH:flavin oxidoreductase/NADH oxidase [Kineosporiaceae bacterium]|nr:NADH:flavin oxidoreductase/NADH oxidase [Kineosporiaceae bacterium]
MSLIFSPLTLRSTTFRNRVWASPMCQYSSVGGMPTDWHLVHLGGLAAGGAGLVMTEATAVTPEGRISPADAGIWTDGQAEAYRRITTFIREQGAVPGIQLAHAGRKASTVRPWEGLGYVEPADGGWRTVAPSAIPFDTLPAPAELTEAQLGELVAAFAAAAARAESAGFEVVELHAAHGYLLHQFLSPLSNRRADAYGDGFEGRCRLLLEVVQAVRSVWPARKPLLVRLSGSDWAEGGWAVGDAVELAVLLTGYGVDLVDVSGGGLVPQQQIPTGPGYQVALARAVREGSGLPVAAVGLITEPRQAEQVLAEGSADAVFLARALLRNPHWPLLAAHELGAPAPWPAQYRRAAPQDAPRSVTVLRPDPDRLRHAVGA